MKTIVASLFVLIVAGGALAEPPTSQPAAMTLSDLLSSAAKYDGKQVVVRGEHGWNFEISRMGDVWIQASSATTKFVNAPADYWKKGGKARVEVAGVFHAAEGKQFGYMKGFQFQIVAQEVVFLPIA